MSGELPAARLAGLGLAAATIVFLTLRVGVELLGLGIGSGEPEGRAGASPAAEAPAAAAPAEVPPAEVPPAEAAPAAELEPREPVGLRISVNDRVRVRVEVDGTPWFRGSLCLREGARCDRGSPLEVPPAAEIAVELSDLSRARLVYKGRRVEPLGNLVAGRRLVFVDDAGS